MKKVLFKFRWIKKNKLNCYTEFGINRTANRFLIGVSTEIEDPVTGVDIARIPGFANMIIKECYIRLWIFKFCLSIGTGEICLEKKEKNHFKLLVGIAGYKHLDIEGTEMEKRNLKINFCISNKCFLSCLGCYNNFSCEKDLKLSKLFSFMKHARLNGITRITFSGGDPFAKKEFKKILKYAKKLGFIINIDTVGTTLIKDANIFGTNRKISMIKSVKCLKGINMMGIPIDGSTEDIVETFRCGRKDLLKEQIEIVNKAASYNIPVCINTVLHRKNFEDLNNIFKLISSFSNVRKWQIFQFMPIGPKGSLNAKQFYISDEEFFQAKKEIQEVNKTDIEIVFKGGTERSYNYMLISSSGEAYKVDLDNQKKSFGNIGNKAEWGNIMHNL